MGALIVPPVLGWLQLEGELYDLELEFATAKGRRRWVRSLAIPEATNGQVTRDYKRIMDITERKIAELAIQALNATLEQRVRERTASPEASAYSVSHDLHVPLRSIDGFSQALLEDYEAKLDDVGKVLVEDNADGEKLTLRGQLGIYGLELNESPPPVAVPGA